MQMQCLPTESAELYVFFWRIVNDLVGGVGEHLPSFWSGKPDIV
jgi:hypothetical protein